MLENVGNKLRKVAIAATAVIPLFTPGKTEARHHPFENKVGVEQQFGEKIELNKQQQSIFDAVKELLVQEQIAKTVFEEIEGIKTWLTDNQDKFYSDTEVYQAELRKLVNSHAALTVYVATAERFLLEVKKVNLKKIFATRRDVEEDISFSIKGIEDDLVNIKKEEETLRNELKAIGVPVESFEYTPQGTIIN